MIFPRKQPQFQDRTTRTLRRNGIFEFQKSEEKTWRNRFPRLNLSVFSGVQYVFLLTLLLWWLPVFGHAIAGYVGGRKAGGPVRGFIVAIVPVAIFSAFLALFDAGFLPMGIWTALAAAPSGLVTGASASSPVLGGYIGGLIEGLKAIFGIESRGFITILAFGIIGGVLAQQNRQELIVASVGNRLPLEGVRQRFDNVEIGKFADVIAERVMYAFATASSTGSRMRDRVEHRLLPTSQDAQFTRWEAQTYQMATPVVAGGYALAVDEPRKVKRLKRAAKNTPVEIEGKIETINWIEHVREINETTEEPVKPKRKTAKKSTRKGFNNYHEHDENPDDDAEVATPKHSSRRSTSHAKPARSSRTKAERTPRQKETVEVTSEDVEPVEETRVKEKPVQDEPEPVIHAPRVVEDYSRL